MKYLKIYEDYYSNQKITDKNVSLKTLQKFEEDVRNILVEVIDKGFSILFTYPNDSIKIEIDNDLKDWFNLSDVYDDILVLVDYMKEKYTDIKFSFNGEKYEKGKYEKGIKSYWDYSLKRYDLEPYKNEYFSFISLNFEEQKKES